MSCISKLGAPSMSRSSTDTGVGTPCAGPQPPLNWSMVQHQQHLMHANDCPSKVTTASSTTASGIDRMSVCSSHGSFGSNGTDFELSNRFEHFPRNSSEYSVPRISCNVQQHASDASQTQEMNSKNQRASGTASIPPASSTHHRPPTSPKQTTSAILPQSPSTAVNANQTCKTCPPSRPPKSKVCANIKAPMPLPNGEQLTSVAIITSQPTQQQQQLLQRQSNKFVGSYENYDVPRTPMQIHQLGGASAAADNYDTPKKIQECLIEDMNCNAGPVLATTAATATRNIDIYGNYDVPALVSGGPDCPGAGENTARIDCTCNKVMSWADSWISLFSRSQIRSDNRAPPGSGELYRALPACRRGNTIENTAIDDLETTWANGVPINKVRLSGEGRMPVVQPSGELAVYATVDMTKKIKRRILDDMKMCECPHSGDFADADGSDGTSRPQSSSNYINIEPTVPSTSAQSGDDAETINQSKSKPKATMENYMNLDYALSLENYENAKEVLQRAGFSVTHIEETLAQCVLHRNICNKCGHTSKRTPNQMCDDTGASTQALAVQADQNNELKMPEDYILMEPSKKNFPGYLPMSPAAPNNGTALSEIVLPTQTVALDTSQPKTPPLPSKSDLMKRILGDKSASNPALGPAVDRSKKRAEQETRIPGSAMMSSLNSGGSPYTRKQFMDNGDLLPPLDKRTFARKRSSSADSTRLSAISNLISSKVAHRRSVSAIDNQAIINRRRASTPCLLLENELQASARADENDSPKPDAASPATIGPRSATIDTDDEISLSMNQSQMSQQSQQSAVYIRRSASVPCKAQNRDSSSSNDSGVSTGSTRQRGNGEYNAEFELPLTTATSAIRHQRNASMLPAMTSTLHASLPRRSKSFDPLREISFQFARNGKFTGKSTSAEAEIPICTPKAINGAKGGYSSPNDATSLTGSGHPYIDSRSTSSGTSDMSDYIETLSLSSHSSSDTPEGLRYLLITTFFFNLNFLRILFSDPSQEHAIKLKFFRFFSLFESTSRLLRQATSTLRPRSGKEYQNIDRAMLMQQQTHPPTVSQLRALLTCSGNYANITPVPESVESPSPGYQSGSSQEHQTDSFIYKVRMIRTHTYTHSHTYTRREQFVS